MYIYIIWLFFKAVVPQSRDHVFFHYRCNVRTILWCPNFVTHPYGVISKFFYPDSDEKHFQCIFTGLRLESSTSNMEKKQVVNEQFPIYDIVVYIVS